ncbi:MAG TPA: hypothetical protein VFG53_19980 [Anaeromyxobacter sp.]|nr:hypothetical protein [Anaeromyxobacter sp.]
MNLRAPLLAFALLSLTSSLAGCVANDASIEIFGVCAPSTDASSCAPTGGVCQAGLTGQAFYFTTTVLGDNGLFFYMQVNNNRPSNASTDQGSLNTADARITEYDLSFDFPGNSYSLPDYDVSPITVTVPAAGSTTPYVSFIPVELSSQLQTMLPAGPTPTLIDIYVKLKGNYIDGSSFETGKFKLSAYVYNAVFPGYVCLPATDVVQDICPNAGQTSTITCAAP